MRNGNTVYKLKNDIPPPFLLGEDESIWPCVEAVRAISCHMRDLKQREQASTGHVVFCIAAGARQRCRKIKMDL